MTKLQRAVILWLCSIVFIAPIVAEERNAVRAPMNSYFPDEDEEGMAGMADPDTDQRVSANVTDERKSGGFRWPFPKPKLPTLPKPSMPKLSLPTWGTKTVEKPQRMADGPSTWEKFNNGTKNMLTKTKHTLMPWTADDEPATVRKKPPATRRTARAPSKSKDKKSFFSSWLETREEEKPIETVNDYLALPRVGYE